uniref:Uncharacterized protein n=1 Tax=Dromaius novaehollandiae TaxID=8790 RepID=A0A8C4J2Q8_DRONO
MCPVGQRSLTCFEKVLVNLFLKSASEQDYSCPCLLSMKPFPAWVLYCSIHTGPDECSVSFLLTENVISCARSCSIFGWYNQMPMRPIPGHISSHKSFHMASLV